MNMYASAMAGPRAAMTVQWVSNRLDSITRLDITILIHQVSLNLTPTTPTRYPHPPPDPIAKPQIVLIAPSWTPLAPSKASLTKRNTGHVQTSPACQTTWSTPLNVPGVTNTMWAKPCSPFVPGCTTTSGTSACPTEPERAVHISQPHHT